MVVVLYISAYTVKICFFIIHFADVCSVDMHKIFYTFNVTVIYIFVVKCWKFVKFYNILCKSKKTKNI